MTTRASIRELLDRLNQVDESRDIEAKKSETDLGKTAFDTISAFANEPGLGGGHLLFGVAELGQGHFAAKGVKDPKKIETELSTLCASAFNRSIRPVVWTEVVDGASIVAAWIPEASPPEKPIFDKKRGPHAGAYRRVGSTDQRCNEDDLRVLFRAADTVAYEDTLVREATEADLSDEVVASYRRQLLDENPATELRDATGTELVQSVGGARRDGGVLVPTVAGVLLFGRPLALRRLFPQIRVDYIRVPGTRWVPDPERRYESIDIREPLLVAFRRAYQAVLDDLPRAFALDPGRPERTDRTAIPQTVIREALVNAITHRDYRIQSAIQIRRFADRIEIENPGRSLVGEEQFGQPGSVARNPHIADVFREMRLAENKGTGIAAMRRGMRLADLTPPIFESEGDRFVTTLWLHSLLDDSETEWLGSLGLDLSSVQRQALVLARRMEVVTNAGLRDVTGLDPIQARRELQTLREAGLLKKRGERGGSHYVLAGQAMTAPGPGTSAPRAGPDLPEGTPVGGQLDADRGELAPDRGELDADRGELDADGGELSAGKASSDWAEAMEALAAEAPQVVDVVRGLGMKPRKEKLRPVILRLCELRPWKASELARVFRFGDAAKLVERHLGPMCDDGVLERTHPENPNHPQQAYRARQLDLAGSTKGE